MFGIFPNLKLFAKVEQVEQFSTVDLVEGEMDFKGGVELVSESKNVLGPQVVHAEHPILGIPVHRVGLAGASLSVGETGHLGPLEGKLNQWAYAGRVQLIIGDQVAVRLVELDGVLLYKAGEVYFDSEWDTRYFCSLTTTSLLPWMSTTSCSLWA